MLEVLSFGVARQISCGARQITTGARESVAERGKSPPERGHRNGGRRSYLPGCSSASGGPLCSRAVRPVRGRARPPRLASAAPGRLQKGTHLGSSASVDRPMARKRATVIRSEVKCCVARQIISAARQIICFLGCLGSRAAQTGVYSFYLRFRIYRRFWPVLGERSSSRIRLFTSG
jgi:hypothetical protein